MKTLLFFIENSLKVLLFIGLLLHVQNSNLYAQDQELFEHTWYFQQGELQGELFFSTENLSPEIVFELNDIFIFNPLCGSGISFHGIDVDDNYFEIIGDEVIIFDGGDCHYPNHENEIILSGMHDSIYGDFSGSYIFHNLFTYNIEAIDDYHQLTIENGEGDWAVYNNVLLSTTDFSKDNFTLYPNPVKETLHITTTANQVVNATIYDLNGKLLQNHAIENKTTTLDVKNLNQGLYFIVFETETGERVSKKFVKK